jgi:hypothetical protein
MTDLTYSDASVLADIMRAVEAKARIRWYPNGTDSADNPLKLVIRAFTHDGGGFWFDSDGDVRNAYIWTSGISEHWLRVSDVMRALRNIQGEFGLDQPMATIDY